MPVAFQPGSEEAAAGIAVLRVNAKSDHIMEGNMSKTFCQVPSSLSEADAGTQQAQNGKKIPVVLVRAIDMYAAEPKSATLAGGVITLLALMGAMAYTAMQLKDYTSMLPTTTSYVEWSDTQGPFPALIKCTAPSGCWVSNRHNDRWSSNGDKVEAVQQGCMKLEKNQEHVMNITFTQNTLNGLVIVWDPSTWENGTTPGSGLQIMAETNYPKAPEGMYMLATPVLGGTYLANHVQTTNNSAPVAKLRREWFITYVSSDKTVVPASTACADVLNATQLAAYRQASIRMPSQWYRVEVVPRDLLLTLVGNCGGALQLCLQAGAILLLILEFTTRMATRWASRKRSARIAPAAADGHMPDNTGLQEVNMQEIYKDQATGQQFMLMGQKPGWAKASEDAKKHSLQAANAVHKLELQSVDGTVTATMPQRQAPGLMTSINGSA